MKNLILILLLTTNCMILHAQEKHKKDHRSYSEFAPDSIAYLEANYKKNSYVGQPFEFLIHDLEVEIKAIEVDFRKDKWIRSIIFYVQSPEQIKMLKQNGEYIRALHGIIDITPEEQPLYNIVGLGRSESFIMPWCEDYVKTILDLKMEMAAYF